MIWIKAVFLLLATITTINLSLALTCYSCTSADTNCINNVTKFTTTPTCKAEEVCATEVNNATGLITRGCKTAADCKEGDCISCTTDNCNNNLICKGCNSSIDPRCATSKANDTDAVFNQVCKNGIKACITRLNAEKNLERSCANDADADVDNCKQDAQNCNSCEGANCNQEIFPSNRRLCYKCSDSKCNNPIENNSEESPCLVVDDKCYSQIKDGVTHRGCLLDRNATLGDCNAESSCKICDTNKCNREETVGDLTCIICRSDNETKCRNEPLDIAEKPCRNNMVKDTNTYGCFKYVNVENVIIRGCLSDADPQTVATCVGKDDSICQSCKDKVRCNDWKDGAVTNTISLGLLGITLLLVISRLS